MTDDKKQNKLSVHFPRDEAEIREAIDLVCAALDKTPSEWAHDLIIKKLQDGGLLDADRKVIEARKAAILGGLSLGQRYVLTEKAKKKKPRKSA